MDIFHCLAILAPAIPFTFSARFTLDTKSVQAQKSASGHLPIWQIRSWGI